MKQTFINDAFKKARGGYSRLLEIHCAKCDTYICRYQKDGSGILKRMYVDRMGEFKSSKKELACPSCSEVLGIAIIYKKENRDAYRLFAGAVTKKIIKSG